MRLNLGRAKKFANRADLIAWLTIGLSLFIYLLRFFELDNPLLIALSGFNPLLFLPILFVTMIGIRLRRKLIGIASAFMFVIYLVTFTPHNAIIGCSASKTSEDSITIYSHNVLWGNANVSEMASEIAINKPDIIVMQETSDGFLSKLNLEPELVGYQYHLDGIEDLDHVGPTIWSKFPLIDSKQERLGAAPITSTIVKTPSAEFRLYGIHTSAPVTKLAAKFWNKQYDLLKGFDSTKPTLLVGDFNATEDHKQFRQLLSNGWDDAHSSKGCGLDNTWSLSPIPVPILRLDHVLHTSHFEVSSLEVGPANNSDHKPVIVRLSQTT